MARSVPDEAKPIAKVVDRYISGTTLRLRRMDTDGETLWKLGQKVRTKSADPEMVKLTNFYLSRHEYELLLDLPAGEIRKTRWRVIWGDRNLTVDEFEGRLSGLVLAEVELKEGEALLSRPPFALLDVTSDDRFSGGSLAFASDDEIARRLAEVAALDD